MAKLPATNVQQQGYDTFMNQVCSRMYEGQLLHTCDKNLIHKNKEDDDNEGGLFGGEKHDDSGHEPVPNSVLNFFDGSAQNGEDAFFPTIPLWKA